MEIRTATKEDLPRIIELGQEFGHLMLYQTSREIMEKYLPRILVAEEPKRVEDSKYGPVTMGGVVGYYHYIVSGDPGFEEMLRCYRQLPEGIVQTTQWYATGGLCICMQGGSHREVFRKFILDLQGKYSRIWCYCSLKSQRPGTYRELGFAFNPAEKFSFWNIHKGDYSTYQLGKWTKPSHRPPSSWRQEELSLARKGGE